MKVLLIIPFLICSPLARSEDKDIVIVNWAEHGTISLIPSLIGATYVGYLVVKNKIKGKKSNIRIDHTKRQFVLDESANTAHAFGPFHFGQNNADTIISYKDMDKHEAAHGLQTGTLGIFSLPLLITSLYGEHNEQPVEQWASSWMYLSESMTRNQKIQFSAGTGLDNGNSVNQIKLGYTFLEKSSRLAADEADDAATFLIHTGVQSNEYDGTGPSQNSVQVVYKYGQVGATHLDSEEDCDNINLSATLFEKNFLGEFKLVLNGLKLLVDSEEKFGSFEIDIKKNKIDATLLSHNVGYGIRLGDRKVFALDLTGRLGYGLKGKWEIGDHSKLVALVGAGYEGKIHVMDQAELSFRQDKEAGTGGYSLQKKTLTFSTPQLFDSSTYTGINGKEGKPRKLYMSVDASSEKESYTTKTSTETDHLKVLMFNIGGRW